MNNEENQTPAPNVLERLTEKFNELRTNLSETLEHAQNSVTQKVDKEVKLSLKQTSKFIDSQKKELETFQKKINALLGIGKKKKTAKKSSAKKPAAKSAKKVTAKKTAKKKKR